MLRYFRLFIFFIFPLTFIYAQPDELNYYSVVDFSKSEMFINVETVFKPGSETLRIRDNSEDIFKKNFFKIFMDSIKKDKYGPLYFNSSSTIEEKIQSNPNILSHVDDINNNIIKIFSIYSRDMAGMNMQYKLNIFKDIGSYFITHKEASGSEKTILWTPAAKYTGVIIYADGNYPVHGENRTSSLYPAIYPAVYDEKMRKVLAIEMVKPVYLEKWGSAGYFTSPDNPVIKERVGEKPLYTIARKLFGRYTSDIIIPQTDADKIFYKGQNTDLIAEGRFIIISTLPSDTP